MLVIELLELDDTVDDVEELDAELTDDEDVLLDEVAADEDELRLANEELDDATDDELTDDDTALDEEPLAGALETELLSLEVPASPPEQAVSSSVLIAVASSAVCDERHKAGTEKKVWDMVLILFRKEHCVDMT